MSWSTSGLSVGLVSFGVLSPFSVKQSRSIQIKFTYVQECAMCVLADILDMFV